jgi:tRNA A-37 threonylcarbamoyl transferase component Bud32
MYTPPSSAYSSADARKRLSTSAFVVPLPSAGGAPTPPPPLSARRPTPDERAFAQPTRLIRKSSTQELDDSLPRTQPRCPPTPGRAPPTPRAGEGMSAHRRATDEELSGKKLLFQSPFYPRRRTLHLPKEHDPDSKRPRAESRHGMDDSEDEDAERRLKPRRTSRDSDSSETSDDDLPSDRIPSFEYVDKLGEGNFGDVWLVRCKENERNYAIKKFKSVLQSVNERQKCLREVHMWNKVGDCPRIVPLIRAWQDDWHFYIQMKFCEGGTLDLYKRGAPLAESELWTTLRDASLALQAIHRIDYVHNDVKPRNMYLSCGHLYLGDFGLMRAARDHDAEDGDSSYFAPEVLEQKGTTPASDIFSLGISFLELAGHVNLPQSGTLLWHELRCGEFSPETMAHVPEFDTLIRRCMHPTPARRPSASDILAHPKILAAPKTVPKRVRVTNFFPRPASAALFPDSAFGSRAATPTSSAARSVSPFMCVRICRRGWQGLTAAQTAQPVLLR